MAVRKSVILLLMMLCASTATAAHLCPKRIAAIEGAPVSERIVLPKMQRIYAALGCRTEFVTLPGRRGIQEFNKGSVDGELFRVVRVEPHYKRRFLRTAKPLTHLISAYWTHPDPKLADRRHTGFVIGVLWQENFMTDRPGVAFPDVERMLKAYRNERIGGFLLSAMAFENNSHWGSEVAAPVVRHVISRMAVHHYLDPAYADFMRVFSDYLDRHRPFETPTG